MVESTLAAAWFPGPPRAEAEAADHFVEASWCDTRFLRCRPDVAPVLEKDPLGKGALERFAGFLPFLIEESTQPRARGLSHVEGVQIQEVT